MTMPGDQKPPQKKIWPPILLLVGLSLWILPAVNLTDPPRFDETGYAILGKSLAEGRGYHEIDKPQAPAHAHFPPGWPMALAVIWSIIPKAVLPATESAHLLTLALWLASIALWHRWYKAVWPDAAWPLCIALYTNWLWIRLAGELRSESLYIALTAGVLALASQQRPKSPRIHALCLGLLVGWCILARQVGVALAAAILLELLWRKEIRSTAIVAGAIGVLVSPWLAWQRATGAATQAQLLANDELARSLIKRLADQALFYTRRLPDSLFGPYVETATVFSRNQALALVLTISAIGFTVVLLTGLKRLLQHPGTRLVALYWSLTLAILLVWPFTEAGRFLIPLVPISLLALLAGGQVWLGWLGWAVSSANPIQENRLAWLLVGLVLPFGAYTWLKNVRADASQADLPYDRACAWVTQHIPESEFIAARHPGDIYWRSGRRADFWPRVNSAEEAAAALKQQGLGFLMVDQGRFVGDTPPGWMTAENLQKRPDLFQLVYLVGDNQAAVRLWRVVAQAVEKNH